MLQQETSHSQYHRHSLKVSIKNQSLDRFYPLHRIDLITLETSFVARTSPLFNITSKDTRSPDKYGGLIGRRKLG